MKILIVVDKLNSAIGRLAEAVKQHSPQHKIKILPVHPKRYDADTLSKVVSLLKWADILDVHYWKSGEVIKTVADAEFKAKPKILFHFNPYDADKKEINDQYDIVVVGNQSIQDKIPSTYLVNYGVDLSFFKFPLKYTDKKIVSMSVARIEGKKGVKEVARVCRELGYEFKLVGRVSKVGYMKEVLEAGKGVITFMEDVNEEQLRDVYYQSAIHVCNSVDNFESGTLPILEAMACGVPVLTRNIGHVPDLDDGTNMVVRKGEEDDIDDLKDNLRSMMENLDWRIKLREKAWETIKNWSIRKMVRLINKLYYRLYKSQVPLCSVIIPTRDNPETFIQCLVAALTQTYSRYEIVVADSGNVPVKPIIYEALKHSDIPIKYIHFDNKGNYTLAEARNRAIIEAEGEYLVFCDDRIRMDKQAIEKFAEFYKPKTWLWGQKDGVLKGFVENFSCVNRKDLIEGGMFNERIQWYGGMTQEIRQRFEMGRGFHFVYIAEAKATGIRKSKSKSHRRDSIVQAKWTLFKMYG
jgi:glycosyltransferase involved in cell wall biosynthesis